MQFREIKGIIGITFFVLFVLPMMMATLFILKHFVRTDIRNL